MVGCVVVPYGADTERVADMMVDQTAGDMLAVVIVLVVVIILLYCGGYYWVLHELHTYGSYVSFTARTKKACHVCAHKW